MARFLAGIDLGTTNSALAFVDLERRTRGSPAVPSRSGGCDLFTFSVPQLFAPGEVREKSLLPSFLYLPGAHDLPAGATALPWPTPAAPVVAGQPAANNAPAVGEFARVQGGRLPGRLVSSAKSWLCHPGVDRAAPLLPWGAPPDVPRLSPLDVSARYLGHLAAAWDHAHANDANAKLGKQKVVITVPASFDDVARELTTQAARQAGFTDFSLLEEPQAAFYCWLATHPDLEAGRLKPGSHCLVIDVGGGTCDFSLIRAGEEQGELAFRRAAVGEHLLLGGDNMDLALARRAAARLGGAKLDAMQTGLLVQASRQAKEALLSDSPPASFPVTVVGRGRSVVGGSLHAELTAADVREVLFDGFFPQTPPDAGVQSQAGSGLHEVGLPYSSDPAVTRHLATFLSRHLGPGERPDAVLFNGGVFQPRALRERVIEVMRGWYGAGWEPLVLTNPSLDLAVAWGAAYSAWLRHSGGRRIGGGAARSYYLGLGGGAGRAVLCVVPRGLEEGGEVQLAEPQLELAIGQPVAFPLYTSTVRADDRPGQVLETEPGQLLELPPLTTVLRGGKRAGVKTVPVSLAARSTEIGTLELFCVERQGSNRWRLEFNVRETAASAGDALRADNQTVAVADVWPEEAVQAGAGVIRSCFVDGTVLPGDVVGQLENALEAPRSQWPLGLCRRLWEPLNECAERRGRTPAHNARWLNLTGFVLRPGSGDALDRLRIEQVWKLLNAPPKTGQPVAPVAGPAEGGPEFWVLWRRVAGGLSSPYQQTLLNRLRTPLLGKGAARPGASELAEMWRCAGSLERLDPRSKEQLGDALVKQLRRGSTPNYALWTLTRLGARVLLAGPMNAVAHRETAERWVDVLAGYEPTEAERLPWAFALAQIARRSGQLALDVDDSHRRTVLAALRTANAPAEWSHAVEEVVAVAGDERSQIYGEALPAGLRLAT